MTLDKAFYKNNTLNIFILYPTLLKYHRIMKILIDNRSEDGITYITQKEISEQCGIHQTAISKFLRKLMIFDQCIELMVPGAYKIHKEDLISHGPIRPSTSKCYLSGKIRIEVGKIAGFKDS